MPSSLIHRPRIADVGRADHIASLCASWARERPDVDTEGMAILGRARRITLLLRARIEALIPPAYGRLSALAGRFKTELRRRLPDLAARRRLLERLLTGRAAELVFAGFEGERKRRGCYGARAAEQPRDDQERSGEKRARNRGEHRFGGDPEGSGKDRVDAI